MTNGYFNISDKLLQATRVAKKIVRGKRCLLGFTIDTDIVVNGITYKKKRAFDINVDAESIVVSTKTENTKIKVPSFSLATITYESNTVYIETK